MLLGVKGNKIATYCVSRELDPLPETCTPLRLYSSKVKDGVYASQHSSIPASGFAGLGARRSSVTSFVEGTTSEMEDFPEKGHPSFHQTPINDLFPDGIISWWEENPR
jgi:hypothetical protein